MSGGVFVPSPEPDALSACALAFLQAGQALLAQLHPMLGEEYTVPLQRLVDTGGLLALEMTVSGDGRYAVNLCGVELEGQRHEIATVAADVPGPAH